MANLFITDQSNKKYIVSVTVYMVHYLDVITS